MNQKFFIFYVWILSISIITVYPQSFEHRKYKYQWNDALKISLQQDSIYKDYDAVILFEETTIDVEVQNIKKYQIFQFNTEESINKYNLFRVPINMNPAISELMNRYKPDTSGFPKLLYEKINFFDARIIRKGEFVKAVLSEVAYRSEERTGDKLLPYYIHYFYVRNLEPGDQLEVVISHHWPLNSSTYYLNESIPKQEMIVTVNNDYLGNVHYNENHQLANTVEIETSSDYRTFKYVLNNIKPVSHFSCTFMDELPRIDFYYDKTTERSYKLFAEDIIDTLNWNKFLFKYVQRIDPNEPRSWETYDDQTYLTTLYYKKIKQLAPDTLDPFSLSDFIHQYTVDVLKFKNDFNFFIHQETGFIDLGKHLKNGVLRESARHLYYYHMLDRINIPYYLVPFQDRRYNKISLERFSPLDLTNVGYGLILPHQSIMLMYPKMSNFGWYTNELPFYFCNQQTFMIPQTVERKIYDKEPEKIFYPFIEINTLPGLFNIKKQQVEVNIKLLSGNSVVNQESTLQGQYSTLLRGYYLNGWKDSTISETYYPSFPSENKSTFNQLQVLEKSTKEPFTFRFKLKDNELNNIYETVDGIKVVDLSGLINIHYEMLDTQYFSADIRTDFQGTEEYIIHLEFDKLVELQDTTAFSKRIVQDEFNLESTLTKIADNDYELYVKWQIKSDRIPHKKIGSLMEAYRYFKYLDNLKLKIKEV